MPWESYRETYKNYISSTSQVEILTLVSGEAVKDFPKHLPEELRGPLLLGMRETANALIEVAKAAEMGKRISRSVRRPNDPTKGKLLDSVLSLFISEVTADNSRGIDERFQEGFERLLSSQAIIMAFAHLDAFISDTMRAICVARPEVLKSEKKIEWSMALTFDKKEDLIKYLIERYVFEFGWLNLSNRVEHLKKQIGLELIQPESERELLDMAENIRHLAVHNGGRASQEFIERTGRNDLGIGDLVPITLDEIGKISSAARLLASDLFASVSKKFFSIEDDQLTGVLRRSLKDNKRKKSLPSNKVKQRTPRKRAPH
jgi:hypothetical protein